MARIGVFRTAAYAANHVIKAEHYTCKERDADSNDIYNENTGFPNVMISQYNDFCLCLELRFALCQS